ncbi:hypothetical protein [Thermomonospora catenispora]|uniref:hypothetical protein n=1 Tax=Thermomonospora catenispora TaxID=2493090 RepID=UPI001F504017|nr:hypothetical protein [Thermomonospora catenispora]
MRPALPELLALLERRRLVAAVSSALGRLGPAAADAVPLLRSVNPEEMGLPPMEAEIVRYNVAWALWEITGDAAPALERAATEWERGVPPGTARRLLAMGEFARPAIGLIDSLLEGMQDPGPAACVLYRFTGDVERTLPHLVAAVDRSVTGMLAMECLADIGPAAADAVPALEEIATDPRIVLSDRVAIDANDGVGTDLIYRDKAVGALERIRG